MALEVGSRLGHYHVTALIGEGGMGQVYQATDTKLNRQVALKILPEAFATDPDRLARFQREAQVLASLNHPGIAAIYGLEESGDTRALVLELVEGPTLADRISQGPIPLDEALPIARQIAAALQAAHQAGVIHRDLKPANIKVRDDGTVKLLDFGLAKGLYVPQHDESAETATALGAHTVSGVILGTPAYMSPEQTRGEALDRRSDIFSLGSVLYEAVTGVRAFGGSSLVGTIVEVTTSSPPPPSSLRSELPAYWDGVLLKALAKRPDRRYSCVADLLGDLDGEQEVSSSSGSAREVHVPDPVFGREAELERLDALLAAAVDGAGKLALVTGEPGIGKTALCGAFVFAAQQSHHGLLLGRGASMERHGTGAAYLPFLEALDGLFQGSGGNHVIALFRRHAPTWCLQFPSVFSSDEIEQLQREVIGATKDRLLRELGDALSALAAERPVVLFLEDLHWADPASVDLLRHLTQRASHQRLLILGTARPEDIERSNHPLKSCKTDLQAHGACDEIALAALARSTFQRTSMRTSRRTRFRRISRT